MTGTYQTQISQHSNHKSQLLSCGHCIGCGLCSMRAAVCYLTVNLMTSELALAHKYFLFVKYLIDHCHWSHSLCLRCFIVSGAFNEAKQENTT